MMVGQRETMRKLEVNEIQYNDMSRSPKVEKWQQK